MRILILTQNYIPEPDPKMHILAKGLVNRGHQVTVITGFPNYPQGKIYLGYKQKIYQQESIDGVRVLRLPLYPDRSRSVLKRSTNYLSFAFIASVLGTIVSGSADVMLVYHPPATLGIPARVIGFLRRMPFVYEIQDMWPEILPATGMVNNLVVLDLLARLGSFTYKHAAAIIVVTPGYKRNLIKKGVPEEKIHVMLNWAYEGTYNRVEPDSTLASEWGMLGKFNVVYAGNMGPAQGLHNVLDAANLLADIPDIQFIFLGHGVDKAKLEEIVRTKHIPNVRFLPSQPMERMPYVSALADVMLVHLTDDPLFEITIPGKTQSSLASGRPMLVSVAGDAAKLVLEAGAGITALPMDPTDLARAVRELYSISPARRKMMGDAGRNYYIKNLAPDVLIGQYEEIFQEVANQ